VAKNKLDELLAAIQPLEFVDAQVDPSERPKAEAATAPEPQGESEEVWTGVVQESVVEGEALRAF
jgi:hypothetical protein